MGRFGIVVIACKSAQHNLVLLLFSERLFVRVVSSHLRCADCPFLLGGFREAYFWKGTSECPICRKPCPSKESNDISKEQDMLVHNLREVSQARRLVYMTGREQSCGKRAATNAFGSADFDARVGADEGLYGTEFRRNKVTGVYLFSFWYATLRRRTNVNIFLFVVIFAFLVLPFSCCHSQAHCHYQWEA